VFKCHQVLQGDLGKATAALRSITLEALRMVHWAPSAKRTASKIAKRVAADRAAPAGAVAATYAMADTAKSSDAESRGRASVDGPARTVSQARAAESRARELVAVLLEHIDALRSRPADAGRITAGVRRSDEMLPAELRVRLDSPQPAPIYCWFRFPASV